MVAPSWFASPLALFLVCHSRTVLLCHSDQEFNVLVCKCILEFFDRVILHWVDHCFLCLEVCEACFKAAWEIVAQVNLQISG
jgi:hypothetical protein